MADTELLCFNGVNGATGQYLMPPVSVETIAAMARGEKIDDRLKRDLANWTERASLETFGVAAGIDPNDLAQSGWGVIFSFDADPAIREALKELLDFRKEQATRKNERFYREFAGPQLGYRPGESNREFLSRLGVDASQPADPAQGVPYYLLLVGDPEQIPYRLQYLLDVQYAVGRIWFDTLEEYAQYARSVVRAERREVRVGRNAVFFGVQNADDRATNLSATELVLPLSQSLPMKLQQGGGDPWTATCVTGAQSTKSSLGRFLGGSETPALLFTASHGMGFPRGNPRQLPHQGALLCQDWPGPRAWNREIPPEHYFAAEDVSADAALQGMIAFHFACYGAGTPRMDDFSHQAFRNPTEIAPHAFVAALPRRLLGHPKGGALAIVGHVERAWGYSFHWNRIGRQLQTFESTLYQLMQGLPVGCATDYFSTRYAALSTELSSEIEEIEKYARQPDNALLAGTWTAHNDARSYIVLGDPAVRLPLIGKGESASRIPFAQGVARIAPSSGILARSGNAVTVPSGGTPSPPPQFGSQPSTAGSSDPFLDQIARAEQRYHARDAEPPAFGAPSGAASLQIQNDPHRLRWRLERLGAEPAVIDDVLRSGTSFRTFGTSGEAAGGGSEAPDDRLLERILGRNDMVDAPRFLERGAKAARAVARIRIQSSSGRVLGWGTGSLIGPRLLLTNNHVLGTAASAAASLAEFNVEDGPAGEPLAPVTFRLTPDDFFATDPALDYTLVAVAPTADMGRSLDDFGFNTGTVGDDPILISETVNIIQHPSGRPKQVALRDNEVTYLLPDFIQYRADTEPGSSGSPAFNDQWELVALHHSGVPKRDASGNIMLRDGTLWRSGVNDQLIDWIANEGVRLSRILEAVRSLPLASPTARQLRDRLFSVIRQERTPTVSTSSPSVPNVSTNPQAAVGSSPVAAPGAIAVAHHSPGGVTLSIPLNITISLGGAGQATVDATPAGAPTALPGSAAIGDRRDLSFAEAVSIDPDYDSREGYDPEFLGSGPLRVPLPKLSAQQLPLASRLTNPPPGADRHELKYHHYSVVMNARRRLAFFTAVNIDGKKSRDIARETDKWIFDPRIARAEQVGEELYANNPFDRGHLVRRLDPAWGRTLKIAKVANDDTFHFTNCSPQHEKFNQGQNLWQGLENFLLERATSADQKLTILTGPVFHDDDPEYRGVRVPLEFWKVAVLVGKAGRLTAVGFIVTQADLVRPLMTEAAIDTARTFQTSIRDIQHVTGLDFGPLSALDLGTVDSFSAEGTTAPDSARRPLLAFADIQLGEAVATPPTGPEVFGAPGTMASSPSVRLGEAVVGTDLSYYLLAYDEKLEERELGNGEKVSGQILSDLENQPVTDVFVLSHGWRGDVPSARETYQGWLQSMARSSGDRERIRRQRPGFRPLLIGLHWPSEPFGDEDLGGAASFAAGDGAGSLDADVARYASRLGDRPEVRSALSTILQAARERGEPDHMPDDVLQAYRSLDAAVATPKQGVAGAPGSDWDVFDPEGIYQLAHADARSGAVSFGFSIRDTLLAPLRVMSFWKMKDRARAFGEQSVHPLLRRMQAITSGRNVRFHLAGHSFGCIVASAAVAGPPASTPLPRGVDSLVLLQGALSLWSYCSSIPDAPDQAGYFRRIVTQRLVHGPIVTTQSRFDSAVGTWYPRAAGVAGQVSFAPGQFPKYGAIGAFGIQGPGVPFQNVSMLPATGDYGFRPGQVYNVEGSAYINTGGGVSGAHSDIRKSEVARMVWNAILAAP
jgi:DNA/RNA endonuclease G (NUC1)/V8-like Glu-specific endopeptidase